ncbi:MAG: hypothetical protein MJ025_02000 [Victivallaceae bacterium]|nr:hypothetical protein [Victivallaceae bacterium]
MEKTILDGVWRCGYTRDAAKVPCFDHAYAVPGCLDAEPGMFGRQGYACFKRDVVIGGMVELSLVAGLHSVVYWDGAEVGRSVLGWSREEYVFDAGSEGRHELVVVCDNVLDPTDNKELALPTADFYFYTGIFDHVTIRRVVPGQVSRVAVLPLNEKTGEVLVKLEWDKGAKPKELEVSFDYGKTRKMATAAEFTTKVPRFKVWSLEHPNLHTITVNGVTARFGIRTVRTSKRQVLLNGKPVKLIGYNRHESHPEFGAATPEALIANDLLMIKRQGCNFIRGSHYTQREFMLDMADEIGLLVWDETLAWGCSEEQIADKSYKERNCDQVERMVRQSINHPSVIIWGFLNECATQVKPAVPFVRRLNKICKKLDPTRLTSYASKMGTGDVCHGETDICALNMYPGWYGDTCEPDCWDDIRKFLRIFPAFFREKYPDMPYLISESGVAAISGCHDGEFVRWSEEYQAKYVQNVLDEVLTNDDYCGLAIWQFCDAKTYVWNPRHTQRPRGFNNKGVVNEYRIPKMAWNAVTERLKKR